MKNVIDAIHMSKEIPDNILKDIENKMQEIANLIQISIYNKMDISCIDAGIRVLNEQEKLSFLREIVDIWKKTIFK